MCPAAEQQVGCVCGTIQKGNNVVLLLLNSALDIVICSKEINMKVKVLV